MARPRPAPEAPPRGELLLDKPRLQLPRASTAFAVLYYTLFTLLGGFGALCCFSTAFQLALHPAPLLVLGGLCAVLGVLQSVLPKGRVVVFAAGALVWGIALLYFSEPAAEGAGRVLNCVLRMYSEKLRIPLRQFAVPEATPQQEIYASTVFAAMLLPPFFWALSWVLARRRSAAAAVSFTGAILSLSMALSILPEFWALCLLLLFWCALLLSGPVLGRRHRVLDERRRFIVCGAAIRPVLLVLVPAAALCMLLLYLLFPRDTYARPHFVNDLRSGFINGFGLEALLQGGQGSNNNRIALDDLRERSYSGKTAMRVYYEWEDGAALGEAQQKDYLKSFVGSVYTGSSWEKLPQGDVDALEKFMAPGRVQNMSASFATLFPLPGLESGLRYNLAVESISTNPRCIFTPYGLSAGEDISGLQAEYVGDGFLRSSNLFSGTHAYQCNAVCRPEPGIGYGLRISQYWADRGIAGAEGDDPGRSLMEKLAGGGDLTPLLYDGRAFKAPDWAKQPLSGEQLALVELTEAYNDFVLGPYLQLPEGLAGFLEEYRASHDMSLPQGEGNYEYFLTQLKEVLAGSCRYTLKPVPVPEGRDFVEFFLSESKTGYCVHFATAAVALCRSAGIPARYAEGYAVPSGYNGVWIDVPDRNAHAWLEVYYSGTGWVPVEVTPVSPDAPATYYNAQAPGDGAPGGESQGQGQQEEASPSPSASPTPRPRASASPRPSVAPTESESPEMEMEDFEKPLWPLALGLLGVLLLVPVGLVVNRAVRRRYRKKAFTQPDRSRAALLLYSHLLRLHALEASLYYGERKPPEYWEETALKARFARDMLPREDLQRLAADAARMEKILKIELPTDRRLYWMYVRGLL